MSRSRVLSGDIARLGMSVEIDVGGTVKIEAVVREGAVVIKGFAVRIWPVARVGSVTADNSEVVSINASRASGRNPR